MKKQFIYIVQPDFKPPADVFAELKEIHKKYVGKQLCMDISNERKRTLPQNSWLHHIVKLITDFERARAKEAGDEFYYKINEERTKLEIKEEFLGYKEINGERHLRKTRNLKTFEMTELWENLQIHYAPLGLDIPCPNEEEYRKGVKNQNH